MLQTAELLKKVRKLEIVTSKKVDDIIGGAYHSVFKGQGIEFSEVREYTIEDDVRNIDWNVSARLNEPFVKKYIEERELTVLLMLDTSDSMKFGSPANRVCDRAVEAAALLGLSAIRNHDRVGLSLFSDRVEKFFTPRNSKHNSLQLLRELVAAYENGLNRQTNIPHALRNACSALKKRSVIFVITDLFDHSEELTQALQIASRRHDVIIINTYDEQSFKLPPEVNSIYDSENHRFIRFKRNSTRQKFAAAKAAELAGKQKSCRRAGAALIPMPCHENMTKLLMNFFQQRKKHLIDHQSKPEG